MSIKEGRCPNCGSILSLDDKSPRGHCLFCDAVFENSKAFEIAADPDGYEFPNEEQPKYEGPSLEPKQNQPSGKIAAVQPAPKKTAARRAPVRNESYVHKEPIKLPDIKLSPKKRLQLGLTFLVIVLLIAAIGIPTVNKRNNDRAQIIAEFTQELPVQINPKTNITVRHVANNYAIIALPEDITQNEAIDIFRSYCEVRASVRSESDAGYEKIYGKTTMKLMTPEGGFMIGRSDSEAELAAGSNIKILQ